MSNWFDDLCEEHGLVREVQRRADEIRPGHVLFDATGGLKPVARVRVGKRATRITFENGAYDTWANDNTFTLIARRKS